MVTGAGGMLAQAMRPALESRGHDVIGVFEDEAQSQRFADAMPHRRVYALGSEEDGATLRAMARVERPDWILHFAAWTDVDGCEVDPRRAYLANAAGSEHVAMAARDVSAPMVAISTDYVFGGRGSRPWVEDDPIAPQSVYARTKWQGEEAVRRTWERHAIVRTAWLYGRGGRNFVDTIRGRLMQEQPVSVVDDQRGCPTWTADLAEGLWRLMDSGATGTFHLTNSGECTWFEFAQVIRELCGARAGVSPTTTESLGRPAARPAYSVLDCGKFSRATGWTMPHWRDALERYLATLTS